MSLTQNIAPELRRLLGAANVLTEKEDLIPYSFDGTAALQQMPGCVAFAKTTEQVVGVLKLAEQTKTAVVTRGSGTGLSGGSLPSPDCLVLCLAKMGRSPGIGSRQSHPAGRSGSHHAGQLLMPPALRACSIRPTPAR